MNKKIKVLNITYGLNVGGIEALSMNIFRNIDRTKFDMDFLVIKDKKEKQFYDEEVLQLGGNVLAVGKGHTNKIKKYVTFEKEIFQLIKKNKYDVVHINSGVLHNLPEVLSAKLLGVKNIIIHSHGASLTPSVRFYKLRYWAQGFSRSITPKVSTHLLTCSDLASKWAYSQKVIDQGKVIQINNGVDLKKYKFNEEVRKKIRTQLNIQDELVIGHIGRLCAQKNQKYLFYIFAEVLKKKKDAKLILCGTGELEKELRLLAKKLKIDNNVIFYGVTKDIPEMLSVMDIFVFPSLFEGLPVVGIEAQAAGLPIYAADTITSEVVLTPCWHTLSLKDKPEIWAREIVKKAETNIKRIDTESLLTEAGFNIKDTTKLMERLYENIS